MSKYRKVANKCYRFEEELVMMIKLTSDIMQRTEADSVRIMLFNSCKYWITKGNPVVKKPTVEQTKGYVSQDLQDEVDIELEAYIAKLK